MFGGVDSTIPFHPVANITGLVISALAYACCLSCRPRARVRLAANFFIFRHRATKQNKPRFARHGLILTVVVVVVVVMVVVVYWYSE